MLEQMVAGSDIMLLRQQKAPSKRVLATYLDEAVEVYFRKVQKHKLNGSKLTTVMFDGCFS